MLFRRANSFAIPGSSVPGDADGVDNVDDAGRAGGAGGAGEAGFSSSILSFDSRIFVSKA